MADTLRRGDGNTFMRLWSEWGDEGAMKHVACVDQVGSMWVHLAAQKGLIEIVHFLLQRKPDMLEAMDSVCGKLMAYAMEPPVSHGAVALVKVLLSFHADRTSPCTASAIVGLGWTPEQLARRKLPASEADEVVALLRTSLPLSCHHQILDWGWRHIMRQAAAIGAQ